MIKIVLLQLHSPMIIVKRWWGVTSSTGGSGSSLNKRSNHEHRRSQRSLSCCPFWQQNSNGQWWRLWQWRQHRWQQRPAKRTARSAESIFASLFHVFWQQGLDQAVQLSRHLPFHSFLLQSFHPLSSPPFFPTNLSEINFFRSGLIFGKYISVWKSSLRDSRLIHMNSNEWISKWPFKLSCFCYIWPYDYNQLIWQLYGMIWNKNFIFCSALI